MNKVIAVMEDDPVSVIFGGIILFLGSFIGIFLMLPVHIQKGIDKAFLESGFPSFMEKAFNGDMVSIMMCTGGALAFIGTIFTIKLTMENFFMVKHWGFMIKHKAYMAWLDIKHMVWKISFYFR